MVMCCAVSFSPIRFAYKGRLKGINIKYCIECLNGQWVLLYMQCKRLNNSQVTGVGVVLIPMPVPSSYNDITASKELRDFVGWAWYDREFYVDRKWTDVRIVLRIDSAHYNTVVVGTRLKYKRNCVLSFNNFPFCKCVAVRCLHLRIEPTGN